MPRSEDAGRAAAPGIPFVIRVIIGHICSGKSTHVRHNARPDDVVIDMDRIALAIATDGTTPHGFNEHVVDVARAARWQAIVRAVEINKGQPWDVWIVHAYPTEQDLAMYRRIGARIWEMKAPTEELLVRAKSERPGRLQAELRKRLEIHGNH